jgi:hypothetical protein
MGGEDSSLRVVGEREVVLLVVEKNCFGAGGCCFDRQRNAWEIGFVGLMR